MIALMTTGLVLLPIVAVSAVLVWAESEARHRETIVAEPRLISALLAARDDEPFREQAAAGLSDRLVGCPEGGGRLGTSEVGEQVLTRTQEPPWLPQTTMNPHSAVPKGTR